MSARSAVIVGIRMGLWESTAAILADRPDGSMSEEERAAAIRIVETGKAHDGALDDGEKLGLVDPRDPYGDA